MKAWMLGNPNLSTLLLSAGMFIIAVAIIAALYGRKVSDK